MENDHSNDHELLETATVGASVLAIGAIATESLVLGGALGVAAAVGYYGLIMAAHKFGPRQQG